MRSTISHRWLLAGIVGLGVSSVPLSFMQLSAQPRSVERNVERAVSRGEDFEEPIPFDRAPAPAREKIDEIRHREQVLAVFRIRRSGIDYIRATVKTPRTERVILVRDDGVVRNVEDIRPDELRDYRANPDAWYRDYDDRMIAHERFYVREAEHVTGTVEHPERVNWDQCPGRVRATLAREANADRLDYVIRYRDHDKVIYQATIDDVGNKRHLVQVLPDGAIFNEGEFTPAGRVGNEDWHIRVIGYEDLPERVRETVNREAPKGRIPRVEVARRRGHDVFTIDIAVRDGTRYLVINDEGKILADSIDRFDISRPK